MTETTIPADFGALEAAVNTGAPTRMEDGKLRGAFESLAAELDVLPQVEETSDQPEPRGLLARLGGERGQTSVEFMGLLPIVLIVVFALWQIALTGYTYVAAGHAAREGARQLAVSRATAARTRPTARPRSRTCRTPGATARTITQVRPRDRVRAPEGPGADPGLKTPWEIGTTADTSVEDEALPERQTASPLPDAMRALLGTDERGQASVELMGMLWWLFLRALVVWQLMLAAWAVDQARNAARTAEPRGGPRRRRRQGGQELAHRGLRPDAKVETTARREGDRAHPDRRPRRGRR